MNKTVLQVPVSQQIKQDAEKAASAQGFSSLQEAVRVFLNKLAQGSMQVSFEDKIFLSKRAITRYNKQLSNIEKNYDVFEANTVKDLIKQLHNAA